MTYIGAPASELSCLASSMTLKERITEDMKTAMRSGEKERLAVIRLFQAAIKQREVDERIKLDDAQVTRGAREDDQAAQGIRGRQFESGGARTSWPRKTPRSA